MADNHLSTFVLSTGRCGTQWLADTLKTLYSNRLYSVHEPLWEPYQPKHFLHCYKSGLKPKTNEAFQQHVVSINDITRRQDYFEAGWPCYGAIPLLETLLDTPVQVIHLIRDPVHVAASLSTHNVYNRGNWTKALALNPFDSGVEQRDHTIKVRWETMTEFEKCLFWWTEINAWALYLKKAMKNTCWLTVQFDDLFSGNPDTFKKIIQFLGFEPIGDLLQHLECKNDRFASKASKVPDLGLIKLYPKTLNLMEHFGYSVDEQDQEEIQHRYSKNKKHFRFFK